jgi:hypothetical protein
MAFLRITASTEDRLRLDAAGIYLRAPHKNDYKMWSELREISRDWLVPWEPQWRVDELSRACYYWRLQGWRHDAKLGLAAPFFIFRSCDDALVGGINISNIRRGVAQDCTIGYWIGKPFAIPVVLCGRSWLTRSRPCICTASKPPASRPTSAHAGCSIASGFEKKAMPVVICASTTCGRIMFYTRNWRGSDFPSSPPNISRYLPRLQPQAAISAFPFRFEVRGVENVVHICVGD